MAKLDLSRDIYHALHETVDSIDAIRNPDDDNTMVLGFGDVDIIIDDLQALEIMQKLAAIFGYRLVDLED